MTKLGSKLTLMVHKVNIAYDDITYLEVIYS
jgi:hypothetical protein